jgi:tetratricopeptide (TPR) repeat protein
MNCRDVEENDILESYVLDRLTDSEREAFEQHYFECDSCFAQLETGLAVREELRRLPVTQKPKRAVFFRRIEIWVPVFAALVLMFGIGLKWQTGRKQQQSKLAALPPIVSRPPSAPPQSLVSLDKLARAEAPPYYESLLRGAEDDAQSSFREAMRHYSRQDYAGSIPGLRAAVEASPQNARFHFYLGACYLLTTQTNSAIASFRRVIFLDNPAYSEAAHFYLAKAYLQNEDVSDAEEDLRATVKFGGSRAGEAQEILRQLGK